MCVKQELVCVCNDKDGELCGRRRSGDLREAGLSSLQLGEWTVQQGGGVSTRSVIIKVTTIDVFLIVIIV